MRLGWDDESLTAPELARAFEQAGVAGVIVHGRTRQQGFKGTVNRAGIRAVVEAVEPHPGRRQRRYPHDRRRGEDVRRDRLRGRLDRPRGPGQSLLLPAARLLEPHRPPGPGSLLRGTHRPDVRALPRTGRAPRRTVRLPAIPQDPQVVLPLHPDAPTALPTVAQPLQPGALRRGRRHRTARKAPIRRCPAITMPRSRFPPARSTSGRGA